MVSPRRDATWEVMAWAKGVNCSVQRHPWDKKEIVVGKPRSFGEVAIKSVWDIGGLCAEWMC